MNSYSQIRETISRVGRLIEGKEPKRGKFLGSCFCVLKAEVFVTAAHCVDGIPREELWINHIAGPDPAQFSPAKQVKLVEQGDLAVIVTEAPEARWVTPFQSVKYSVDYGERVCAFGYPESIISDPPAEATARFFRGYVQRPFMYCNRSGKRYKAFELSFSCPNGLNGGPVFLEADPVTVIGVVTANVKSYTVIDEEEDVPCGNITEFRQIINYGVAANVIYAADVLERILGRTLPNKGVTQH